MVLRSYQESHYRLTYHIITAHSQEYDKTWGGPHVQDDYNRLYVVENEGAEVEVDGHIHELMPGNVYLFPLNRLGHFRSGGNFFLHWLHFRLTLFSSFDVFQYHMPHYHYAFKGHEMDVFKRLEFCVEQDTPRDEVEATGLIAELISPFLPEDWDAIKLEALDTLQPALQLIHEMYMSPDLRLEDLAGSCELHPTYFSNMFKEKLGITPVKYLTRHRINQAKNLLLNTSYSVSRVATMCGFRDAHYFSRVFSNQDKRSPKDYRKLFSDGVP
jgi:AraC-like DNA-binding protein